jgi:hypothetical protein
MAPVFGLLVAVEVLLLLVLQLAEPSQQELAGLGLLVVLAGLASHMLAAAAVIITLVALGLVALVVVALVTERLVLQIQAAVAAVWRVVAEQLAVQA